jgi:hypothetical protein
MPIIEQSNGYELLEIKDSADWKFIEKNYRSFNKGPTFPNVFKLAQENGCRSIVIENQYIDPCYRDQVSFLYSKTLKEYSTYCTRLHLFNVRYKSLNEIKNIEIKDAGYLGYIVITPLEVGNIGRTVLCPSVINNNKFYYLCAASFKAHLFGKEFTVFGTPFIQQDTMVMRCAQASIWMSLRFMKEIYDLASPYPSEITVSANKYLNLSGRTSPSEGLGAQQTVNALSDLGYSPIIYSREEMEKEHNWDPVKLIYKYMESQIPIIIIVPRHVITIIGHVFESKPQVQQDSITKNIVLSDLWTSAFIIHDDAVGPYRLLPVSGEYAKKLEEEGFKRLLPSENSHYKTVEDIKAIIVPLPPKVYYTAQSVDTVAQLIQEVYFLTYVYMDALTKKETAIEFLASFNTSLQNPIVLRSYIMLSEKYKKRMYEEPFLTSMAEELRDQYKKMKMSRFIWIVEITNASRLSKEKEEERTIFGEVILDATASRYGPAWLSIHLPGYLFLRDPNKDPSVIKKTEPIPIPNDRPYGHHSRRKRDC